MTRSAYSFCHGDLGAVRTVCMFMPAMVVATPGKDRIAIVNQISRRFILRKGIAQLLRSPSRRRMLGDRHVNDSPTVVREDDKYQEQPERDRWHDKEVGGHDLARVIRQEGAPRL